MSFFDALCPKKIWKFLYIFNVKLGVSLIFFPEVTNFNMSDLIWDSFFFLKLASGTPILKCLVRSLSLAGII